MSEHANRPTQPGKGAGKLLDLDTWDALKAAGFSEEQLYEDQPFGPVIFAYTRADALRDGVLIDVTELATRVGFRKIHTAVTCGVMESLTELVRGRHPEDFTAQPLYRVQSAAATAMLSILHDEIARGRATSDRLHFDCAGLPLWSHIGPGDEGEPVITIMLEGED